jgi:hypothetical protein
MDPIAGALCCGWKQRRRGCNGAKVEEDFAPCLEWEIANLHAMPVQEARYIGSQSCVDFTTAE